MDLTCPANVTFEALRRANFAIVTWEKPVATQGGKLLPDSLISYPQGVYPGLPFPFGTLFGWINSDVSESSII